jgi:hypothetical protein
MDDCTTSVVGTVRTTLNDVAREAFEDTAGAFFSGP